MKRILVFFCSLIVLPSVGQNTQHRDAVKISAGMFYADKHQLGNLYGNAFEEVSKTPFKFVSLSLEHPRNYRQSNFGAEVGITYYLNQKVMSGDSMDLNWFANSFYTAFKCDLLPKVDFINIMPTVGIQLGAQRIIVNNNSVYKNFNAVLIPGLEIQLQLGKRIVVGATANYLYDFTKGSWRRKKGDKYTFNASKFRGFNVQAYIGFCFW